MSQSSPKDGTASPDGTVSTRPSEPTALNTRYPWAVFILPFAVFIAVGSLEPAPPELLSLLGWDVPHATYPVVYTIKIVLVMAMMALVWPGYRQFPWKVSLLAPAVGVAGVVVWISLCKLDLEKQVFGPLGLDWLIQVGQRSAFNPFEYWADAPHMAYAFLAVRFWGLAVIVAVIEEFFLRGFVMRYFINPDWLEVPFGTLTTGAMLAGTLVPILLHPAEMVAAGVWFSMVTWLMWRMRNLWDCVVAHAVTNLLLGIYVVASGDWYFM